MPGVTVTTALRVGPTVLGGDPASRAFFVGISERGPVGRSVDVHSIAQFEKLYGVRQSYSGALYDAVRTFFEEGGDTAYICRVVGAAAVVASLTLNDRAGTPAPTIKLSALSPGAWASEITVQIATGTLANTVKILVYSTGSLVESWDNLDTIPNAVLTLTTSQFIRGTNLNSAASGVTALPNVAAAAPLAGGADDRGTVTALIVTTAANTAFSRSLGPGAVCAPGYNATQVGAALIAHAKANRRIALLSGDVTADVTALLALAAPLATDGGYAGIFGPWVVIPDGAATRTVDPVGYVAGVRARAINAVGFWQRPAGDSSLARFVISTAYTLDETANNALAAAGVSGVITSNDGIRLYGWYGLVPDGSHMALLSNTDAQNSLSGIIESTLRPFVWRTIDGRGQLFSEIQSALTGVLQPIADAGGLYPQIDASGDQVDPGYSVRVDDSLNPVDQLAANVIVAEVGYRLSPALAELKVNIYQSSLTSAV